MTKAGLLGTGVAGGFGSVGPTRIAEVPRNVGRRQRITKHPSLAELPHGSEGRRRLVSTRLLEVELVTRIALITLSGGFAGYKDSPVVTVRERGHGWSSLVGLRQSKSLYTLRDGVLLDLCGQEVVEGEKRRRALVLELVRRIPDSLWEHLDPEALQHQRVVFVDRLTGITA